MALGQGELNRELSREQLHDDLARDKDPLPDLSIEPSLPAFPSYGGHLIGTRRNNGRDQVLHIVAVFRKVACQPVEQFRAPGLAIHFVGVLHQAAPQQTHGMIKNITLSPPLSSCSRDSIPGAPSMRFNCTEMTAMKGRTRPVDNIITSTPKRSCVLLA